MITELAPGVFCVDHSAAEGKNGIVFGRRGALAIDVGTYPDEGQTMADFIRAQGGAPDRVLLTHGHSDHVLGGQAFAGAEVFAHLDTPAVIRRQLRAFAERKGLVYEDLIDQPLQPTVMFSDRLEIDLGDRRLHVFPTPGHSEDGVSVYLEAERLLFAGDTVVTGIVPAIGDGDSHMLESSLRGLHSLDIDILVAGHGPVLRGRAQIQDWLRWMENYLTGVRDRVREAIRDGLTDPEVIADRVPFETLIGDRLSREKHNMPGRHRATVLKIAAEELARGA